MQYCKKRVTDNIMSLYVHVQMFTFIHILKLQDFLCFASQKMDYSPCSHFSSSTDSYKSIVQQSERRARIVSVKTHAGSSVYNVHMGVCTGLPS